MTTRYKSLTVVLEMDIRNDDAEPILEAIRMVKGVLSVEGNVTDDLEAHIAYERVRHDLGMKIYGILYPNKTTK
jgi:hypothetical protein